MLNRIAAVLLALMLSLCPLAALAEDDGTFATCVMPEGAETIDVYSLSRLEVPQGLETLYAAMSNASNRGDVYITRMKNGLALISLACQPLDQSMTPPDLLDLLPQIQESLTAEFPGMNQDELFSGLQQLFGREVLALQATVPLTGDDTALLMGFAFPRKSDMIEVWAAVPNTYADSDALASDQTDLWNFLGSLAFTTGEEAQTADLMEHETYTDPDGLFSVGLPAGCTVLTANTTPEQLEAARRQFESANPEGASPVFDGFVKDMQDENATVVFSADWQCALEFFTIEEEALSGLTTSSFLGQAEQITQNLTEKYQYAMHLQSGRRFLSGFEHSQLSYWVRQQDYSFHLDVLATITGEKTLREIDLYTPASGYDTAQQQALLELAAQTLEYR